MGSCHNKTDEVVVTGIRKINTDHLKHSKQPLQAVYSTEELGDADCPGLKDELRYLNIDST